MRQQVTVQYVQTPSNMGFFLYLQVFFNNSDE